MQASRQTALAFTLPTHFQNGCIFVQLASDVVDEPDDNPAGERPCVHCCRPSAGPSGRCYKQAMDHVDASSRSAIMRAVKPKGSGPEMVLRRMLHAAGYRYALHRADLPGKPDLVFPARRKILFVHGCFWHRHGCRYTTDPKTREDFWQAKFSANVARDKRSLAALREAGWRCLVVWQCQLKEPEKILNRVQTFLEAA